MSSTQSLHGCTLSPRATSIDMNVNISILYIHIYIYTYIRVCMHVIPEQSHNFGILWSAPGLELLDVQSFRGAWRALHAITLLPMKSFELKPTTVATVAPTVQQSKSNMLQKPRPIPLTPQRLHGKTAFIVLLPSRPCGSLGRLPVQNYTPPVPQETSRHI